MNELSANAVKGFLEECYRKGFNEKQAAYLMEASMRTSPVLFAETYRDSDDHVPDKKYE